MKPKLLLLLVFFCAIKNLQAQSITINEYQGNRPLKWTDFRGVPEESSPFAAKTFWNIRYTYKYKMMGDSVKLEPLVFLELGNLSWAKEGKKTDELLKHEQGHFNTGVLCARELLAMLQSKSFPKEYFSDYIKRACGEIIQKYKNMDLQYDAETDHSKNKPQQKKWDEYYTASLNAK